MFKIEEEEESICVAMSEDGTLIASGHENGIVRSWNGVLVKAAGEPMSVDRGRVSSLA